MWQDFVLTIGSIIFIIALIPSVLSKDKPALFTSIITSSVLIVMAIVYFSLSLYFTAVTTFITGILWGVLAFQKIQKWILCRR